MAPTRDAFGERFRALPRADAVAFLADLHEAQGFSVDRRSDGLAVRRPPDGPERIIALENGADNPDVVVAWGELPADMPAGTDVLDVADLYEQTRYAVDTETSERLLETYFDGLSPPSPERAVPLHDGDADDSERGDHDGQNNDGDDAGQQRPGADPAVLAEARSATAAAPTAETDARRLWSRRATLLGAGAVIGGAAMATVNRLAGQNSVTAPGVTDAGVTDPAALAAAHSAAIDARSYTLAFQDVHLTDRLDVRMAHGLDISLSSDRGFLAEVNTAGPEASLILGQPPAVAVFWSDGDTYYVDHLPEGEGAVSAFEPPRGWVGTWRYWAHAFAFGGNIGNQPQSYFETVLSAVSTRLVDRVESGEETRYRLVGRTDSPASPIGRLAGTDHRSLEHVTIIDGRGLIRSHDLEYGATFDDGAGTVRRSIEYGRIGETTVSRPTWTR